MKDSTFKSIAYRSSELSGHHGWLHFFADRGTFVVYLGDVGENGKVLKIDGDVGIEEMWQYPPSDHHCFLFFYYVAAGGHAEMSSNQFVKKVLVYFEELGETEIQGNRNVA